MADGRQGSTADQRPARDLPAGRGWAAGGPGVGGGGVGWATAVGAEAHRLGRWLELLARVAGAARVAGTSAAVLDTGRVSSSWRQALGAAATAVAEQAGTELALQEAGAEPGVGPPLGLLAVDLDDETAVSRAAACLAESPGRLLPTVVVPLRRARPGSGDPETAARVQVERLFGAGAMDGGAHGRRPGRLIRLPGMPWPVGDEAPGVVEWAVALSVADHPRAGVLHPRFGTPLPDRRPRRRRQPARRPD